jgi:hypothetical protein
MGDGFLQKCRDVESSPRSVVLREVIEKATLRWPITRKCPLGPAQAALGTTSRLYGALYITIYISGSLPFYFSP